MVLTRPAALGLIQAALREDAASRDLTTQALFSKRARLHARILAKEPGILAGGPIALWTFLAVDRSVRGILKVREGAKLWRGETILTLEGRARSIFAAERVALNFLGHLCGIATLTRAFVERVRPQAVDILDTRKTLPGLRALEKYAVRIGGGKSHRAGLGGAILIKTNHLRALGYGERGAGRGGPEFLIREAIARARGRNPAVFTEIEVTGLAEFRAALKAGPDAILLDNWKLADIRRAVEMRHRLSHGDSPPKLPLLEVSGGLTLQNARSIAATDVERLSIGRLTHSAPSLDVSLKVTLTQQP